MQLDIELLDPALTCLDMLCACTSASVVVAQQLQGLRQQSAAANVLAQLRGVSLKGWDCLGIVQIDACGVY